MPKAHHIIHDYAMRSNSTRSSAATFAVDSSVPFFSTCYFAISRSHMEGGFCLQVEEGKLTRAAAVIVYKAACQVASKDGSEVIIGYLRYLLIRHRRLIRCIETDALNYGIHANFVK